MLKSTENFVKNMSYMFQLATETEFLFRPKPIPKPKGVLHFRQNQNSAKTETT